MLLKQGGLAQKPCSCQLSMVSLVYDVPSKTHAADKRWKDEPEEYSTAHNASPAILVSKPVSCVRMMLCKCLIFLQNLPPVQQGLIAGRFVAHEIVPRLVRMLYHSAGVLAGICEGLQSISR